MQPFAELSSNGVETATGCAGLLLETMPRVMRAVRAGLGGGAGNVAAAKETLVTVPQYRVLVFLVEHQGASLSQVAEFMGLSLPSASKLVDHLVRRGIIDRESDIGDRRKITLRVSRAGDALVKTAQRRVRRHLAEMLRGADAGALRGLGRALKILQLYFPPPYFGGGEIPRRRNASPAATGKSALRSSLQS